MAMAGILDALFVIRVVIARIRKETSNDWKIYLAILASSILWIELLFDLFYH